MIRPGRYFSLRETGGRFYFVQERGRRVRTDPIGKLIWENLPGDVEVLKARVAGGISAGELPSRPKEELVGDFIGNFIAVLVQAGIVEAEDGGHINVSPILESDDTKERVSVVVVTHNGAAHVRDCFRSLIAQSYPNLEIIAVDNGSKDATREILKKDFPSVRIVALPRNVHFARGVNVGIRNSQGRYLFILNQDVEVDLDCVSRLVGRMRAAAGGGLDDSGDGAGADLAGKKPRAGRLADTGKPPGAVVPMMRFFDLRGFVNGIGNQMRSRGWGSDNFIGFVDVGQFADLEEVPSACFGAVLIDRRAVDEVGLLDEKYTAFYEDADWSFRCWMKGWRIVPEPRAVVYHKFGASYPSRRKLRLAVRNRLRLVVKLFRGRSRRVYAGHYFVEDLRNFLSFVRRGRLGFAATYPGAYASLLAQLPGILRSRRRTQDGGHIHVSPILALNPAVFSALDEAGDPVIDSRIVAGFYSRLLRY
jgi:hypothetical protein